MVPDSVHINGFADDHSLQKIFKAGTHNEKPQLLEDTFNSIKDWMDKKQPILNSDKTEYILFGSKQKLNEAAHEPFEKGMIS